MTSWQPIETAPRDGTEVLGFDKETEVTHVTYWDHYKFHDPDNHYYSEALPFKPTHWQPLPEPPTT